MKKKIVSVVSMVLLLCMVFSTNIYVASSRRETITLLKNQIWNERSPVTRSMASSKVYARCYAVYPTDGGGDTFTKIRVRLRDGDGYILSDIKTLYDTATENTTIIIKDGYLDRQKIYFVFSGNNPDYGAYADVYYDGN